MMTDDVAQAEDAYTVVLRGEAFKLSRSQLESEPGNMLADALLGDFQEGQTRTMKLDRNPAVFKLILEHLSGYTILPLCESDWSAIGLSEEKLLRYLKDDAVYYCMSGLQSKLQEEEDRKRSASKTTTTARFPVDPKLGRMLLTIANERKRKGFLYVSQHILLCIARC